MEQSFVIVVVVVVVVIVVVSGGGGGSSGGGGRGGGGDSGCCGGGGAGDGGDLTRSLVIYRVLYRLHFIDEFDTRTEKFVSNTRGAPCFVVRERILRVAMRIITGATVTHFLTRYTQYNTIVTPIVVCVGVYIGMFKRLDVVVGRIARLFVRVTLTCRDATASCCLSRGRRETG